MPDSREVGGALAESVTGRPMHSAGGPSTLAEMLQAAAATEVVFHLREGERALGIDQILSCGRRAARRLQELGVCPGDRVAVLGPNRPEWLVWAVGTWVMGATLVPVQIPLRRRDPAAFAEQLSFVIDASRCRIVLADPELLRFVPDGRGVAWGIDALPTQAGDPGYAPAPQDIAVLQFTSGSTARPKGAQLSHRAVIAQLNALTAAMGSHAVCFGWAPFFHDLGLFGCLLAPIVMGSAGHHLPTELFARAPDEWLRLCSVHRAGVTVGPSSAWSVALRTVLRRGETLDLSALRRCYFAAEGIDPDVVHGLLESCSRFGLAPTAFAGTYGMAETVLAVTMTPADQALRFEAVDVESLAARGVADAADGSGPVRQIVSSGYALAGMEFRIDGPGGHAPDRQLGEISVRGVSLMRGYDGPDAVDPLGVDGWLPTGDSGFVLDGELFVTGRLRDVVIVLGHNYHAEDFEWAAERVPGVRRGRSVAFVPDGSEHVVLVVEPEAFEDHATLGGRVRLAVGNAIGVAPAEVVLVGRGSVLKTSSGKTRRGAMKAAYRDGELRRLPASPGACP